MNQFVRVLEVVQKLENSFCVKRIHMKLYYILFGYVRASVILSRVNRPEDDDNMQRLEVLRANMLVCLGCRSFIQCSTHETTKSGNAFI